VAYDEDGVIQAIAVFDSFTVDACSVHFAIDNPFVIRHGFLHEIARHLFIDCGRERIFGLVPSDNEKALKLDQHIGMEPVARIPDAMKRGVDYVVMRMNKEDCRWLPKVELKEAANG
jgi:RimJ/RimL family protein N-acetyltransferase